MSTLAHSLPPASLSRRTIVGDLDPARAIPPRTHLLIISRDQSWLTHGFHKYPAKFFPELPRWALLRYSAPGQLVLDPMAGSGTVNVECRLLRRNSVAVDIDPFARLLTQVKTTPLDPQRLAEAGAAVLDSLAAFEAGGARARAAALEHMPSFHYRDSWFRPFILEELGAIRMAIGRLAGTQADAQAYVDFFRICLSSIVREVSNADNNCTRTVVRKRLNKRIVPGMALRLFRRLLQVNTARMRDFAAVCPPEAAVQIPEGADARSLPLAEASVDLAVTSPPYINAVDYPRTHQLEMYLLDLTPPGQPLAEAKRSHIGTEVVRASDYRTLHRSGLPALDEQVADLYRVDPRRAYVVYRYFVDMERNLAEVRRTLKPGGRYVVVVGNNLIRGREVPTHAYLMELATRVGFEVETYFASEVIRHYIKVPRKERIAMDWVLVLRR
ncbi:MAG TPA: DNA methyltransferase [Chloroflexota bacterium]|nr:DNA methyltransferase [Chloroflexota bacterium]